MQLPSTLDLIKQLLAMPSIRCVKPQLDQSHQAVIEGLAEWCEQLGFRCKVMLCH